jgi:hypothetical protein
VGVQTPGPETAHQTGRGPGPLPRAAVRLGSAVPQGGE